MWMSCFYFPWRFIFLTLYTNANRIGELMLLVIIPFVLFYKIQMDCGLDIINNIYFIGGTKNIKQ